MSLNSHYKNMLRHSNIISQFTIRLNTCKFTKYEENEIKIFLNHANYFPCYKVFYLPQQISYEIRVRAEARHYNNKHANNREYFVPEVLNIITILIFNHNILGTIL